MMISGGDLPEGVLGIDLTANSFNFLGVPVALGRPIQASDAPDGQDPQSVVVLGYKFWLRHFNADPSVLGKTIQLDHQNYSIVGVAGQRFVWGDGDDVLFPLENYTADPDHRLLRRNSPEAGRVACAGRRRTAAAAGGICTSDSALFPPGKLRLHVVGLNEQFVQDLGGTLYLLFGAVALLLMIGCANVSILLLARATARQHEFAVRSAIGATRIRIILQLLTEALLLSVTGAGFGILLAYKTVSVIAMNLPESSFPHEAAIGSIDGTAPFRSWSRWVRESVLDDLRGNFRGPRSAR